ncbi:MAG: XRE family transcriptional regulator [Chloroflexota bacterium]|nr:MAG: XRE family transcriptional regulator [Chloroflexota bacterium]
MAARTKLIPWEDVLTEQLRDPEFRSEWDRTALARAVANAVVTYRSREKLSQKALAAKLAMKQPAIARLEIGEHNPSIETLERLASALGLRFIVDVAPAGRTAATLPPDVKVVADATGVDGTRVLVAAG